MSYAIKLNTAQRYGQNLSLEIRGSLMAYVLKQIGHQMLFAAEEAIRHILLMLPYATKPLLDGHRVRKLSNLLELVDTNHKMEALLLCYQLR